ncbi:hypothetical protein SAMN05192534_103106 [Alteribacillus persepolensis]|uniref:Uncharacterized protein n=1 Tax=Alteribacillus persepolensis TaxID=568899 RepID=A0A1G8B1D6_9BACI|nr:hypothetical protein [Alteribacillus persepolensis]SDH26944.1 hypothetical protein SAMN05192534_103106 [Alteribacillus persepolensis]
MSSQLQGKLQDILQASIQSHEFDKAEQAVMYMKQLAEIEAFVTGDSIQTSVNKVSAAVQENRDIAVQEGFSSFRQAASEPAVLANQRKQDTLMLYYMADEKVLKFKKTPQTYAVSLDFFREFLRYLELWKGKEPFSSKTYYETFAGELKPFTTYQSSTLRQFITLLFRYCYKLNVLEKPTPPQRSRYYVNSELEAEEVIKYIAEQKILQL